MPHLIRIKTKHGTSQTVQCTPTYLSENLWMSLVWEEVFTVRSVAPLSESLHDHVNSVSVL